MDPEETKESVAQETEPNTKLIIGIVIGIIFLIGGLAMAVKHRNFHYGVLALTGSAVIIWTTASDNAGETIEIIGAILLAGGAISAIKSVMPQSADASADATENGYVRNNEENAD